MKQTLDVQKLAEELEADNRNHIWNDNPTDQVVGRILTVFKLYGIHVFDFESDKHLRQTCKKLWNMEL